MIRLHSTGLNDATILSNIFIDRFMPKANGEFVKVYIYLLRMLGRPEEAFGLSQMADSLFCTEGDILRALKYWESEKLVTLLYEEAELTGITLQAPWNEADMLATVTPSGTCNAGSLGDVPDAYHISAPDPPAGIPNAPTDKSLQTDQLSYRSTDLPVPPPSSKPLSETKALTPDRVKELKQNEDIIQLLYIAEQYLGKTLTPTETRKILFFYDELHMSVDLIDYLIEYCVGRDHRSIRYIETVAMAWREEGITTVEMAKDSTSRYSKEYFSVLKAMGIANRNPSDAEISLINTWTRDYGFSMELIQEACSRTILQTGQPSFPYADKILQRWKDKNIRTLGDVRLQDAQHQKRKLEKAVSKADKPKSAAPNRFNNFHQRDYDFAEYEKKLLNKPN